MKRLRITVWRLLHDGDSACLLGTGARMHTIWKSAKVQCAMPLMITQMPRLVVGTGEKLASEMRAEPGTSKCRSLHTSGFSSPSAAMTP